MTCDVYVVGFDERPHLHFCRQSVPDVSYSLSNNYYIRASGSWYTYQFRWQVAKLSLADVTSRAWRYITNKLALTKKYYFRCTTFLITWSYLGQWKFTTLSLKAFYIIPRRDTWHYQDPICMRHTLIGGFFSLLILTPTKITFADDRSFKH